MGSNEIDEPIYLLFRTVAFPPCSPEDTVTRLSR